MLCLFLSADKKCFRCIPVCVSDKPRLNRRFTVELSLGKASMSWPKPTGSFTKQVIEKWKYAKREKREAVSTCMIAGNCEEEVIPIDQTSHTTNIEEDKEYKFILVLYDREVKVAQFEAAQIKPKGKLVKVLYFHIYMTGISRLLSLEPRTYKIWLDM